MRNNFPVIYFGVKEAPVKEKYLFNLIFRLVKSTLVLTFGKTD